MDPHCLMTQPKQLLLEVGAKCGTTSSISSNKLLTNLFLYIITLIYESLVDLMCDDEFNVWDTKTTNKLIPTLEKESERTINL